MALPFYSVFFPNFMAEPFYSVFFSPYFPTLPFYIVIAVSNYSTLGGPTLPFYRPPKWAKRKDQKNGTCPFIVNSVFFCELSCLCGLPFFQNIVHWGGPLFQNIVYWGGPPPQIIAIKRQVGPPPPKSKGHISYIL